MNQSRLKRIIQIVWLAFAAFCIVEGTNIMRTGSKDVTVAYMLFAIAVLALVRFILLRRSQLKEDKRI